MILGRGKTLIGFISVRSKKTARLKAKSITRNYSLNRNNGWESVIGLEVHAQISTESKLFSSASTHFGGSVNNQVALFDCSIPGTLPILNKKCVEASVLTAIALECKLNHISTFDRKHYFYADLPAGYQITQQRQPIAQNGVCEFIVYNPELHKKPYHSKAKIRQLQLEQDSGRSIHDEAAKRSLIDLNRAGVPLMEIVFDPDLKDGEEAAALVKELSLILQRLGTCNCKMDEGALRVDANVSIRRPGEKLGTRTEVKNLNSIRSLANAIEFEIKRQIGIVESGGIIINETRGYDASAKETVPMRDKEVKQDYRFMPEPNLPPIHLVYDPVSKSTNPNVVNIAEVQKKLKELPEASRKHLIKVYNLRLDAAMNIVSSPGFLEYFKAVMKHLQPSKGIAVSNRLQMELVEQLYKKELSFENCALSPNVFAELFIQYESGKVNLDKFSDVIKLLIDGDTRPPEKIIEDEGWTQITDESVIVRICEEVVQENLPLAAKHLKAPEKPKHFNKLMKLIESKGNGNLHMKTASGCLKKILEKSTNH